MQNVVQQLNSATVIHGKFEQQKQLQGLDYPLTSSGHFIFWKEKGLYLASDTPFFNASTITLDNIIHWQENGTGSISEEQSGLIQREISRTLLAFFSADVALIEERFTTEWQFDGKNWQLLLTPRHDMVRKQMRSAELRGEDYIESLRIVGENGDVTQLNFTDINSSDSPTPEQCRWFYLDDVATHCAAAP
ncbi:outer membrane lipoprotein carrier protein LolA [Cellvibrio sp. PSBB006]|uniref:outer membrane lipoprotein carrier protein LolA n=1 Tax=Cellvibrio sp. PSBB006 TaxID=1987723 RepID=UPI0021010144|nr:outer membrane lipoprotein carrier protein LolA [Cellvibrio sp. PSBB006]